MTEEEFQSYRPSDMIAVDTRFMPSLELTDEITNASLEDLIIEKRGNYRKYDQEKRDKWIQEEIEQAKARYLAEGRRFTKADEKSIISLLDFEEAPLSQTEYALIVGSTELKFVPVSSNLAKVYYLEDKGGFIRNNQKYYYSVLLSSRLSKESEKEQEDQKEWDKYL
jgi:hypothetical protein